MLQECVRLLCIIHLTSCLTFEHACIKEAHSVFHSGCLLLHSLCIPNTNLLNGKAVCCTHSFFYKRLPFIQVCSDSQLNSSTFFSMRQILQVPCARRTRKYSQKFCSCLILKCTSLWKFLKVVLSKL